MVTFFQILLFIGLLLLSLFMILIILLQRGKGGGLVGAFGGLGGSSAFGAKTSDVFLRVTIVSTFIWFVLCIGGRYILNARSASSSLVSGTRAPVSAPADAGGMNAAPAPAEGAAAPVEGTPATDVPAPAESAAPAEGASATDAPAPAGTAAPTETAAPAPTE